MEECEGLDPEVNELQVFSETVSQDDEDEVEELQNRCLLDGSGLIGITYVSLCACYSLLSH